MSSSLTLFRIFGIPFRINYTWLIIFGLVLSSLALFQFPDSYPHWSPVEDWLVAGVTTLLFFTSVVLHELSHSLVAIKHRIPVKSITLFIFGGVAHISKEAERPRVEAAIALAGPISSLLIAGAFAPLAYFAGSFNEDVKAVATTLTIINIMLAVFNLVPGFPLDGGRVLRAILWTITHDYRKATRVSTFIGRFVAYSMIAGGAVLIFLDHWQDGIWLILMGLFLDAAAVATYRHSLRIDSLRRSTVADLMLPLSGPEGAYPGAPVFDAAVEAGTVLEYLEEKEIPHALVVRDGRLVGVVNRSVLSTFKERL